MCFNVHHAWLWYQVYKLRWPSGDDWCNRHTKASRQTTRPPAGWNNRKGGLLVYMCITSGDTYRLCVCVCWGIIWGTGALMLASGHKHLLSCSLSFGIWLQEELPFPYWYACDFYIGNSDNIPQKQTSNTRRAPEHVPSQPWLAYQRADQSHLKGDLEKQDWPLSDFTKYFTVHTHIA